METLIESIKRHEGYRDHVYLDSERILTCGWGHALRPGTKVPLEVNEAFFKQDVARAISAFDRIPKALRDHLNVERRRVIVEMLYNLGFKGVYDPDGDGGFDRMWLAISMDDFGEAAMEMLDSKWAGQVKGRAVELAYIMRHGRA